jgi:hypothetical protein
MPRNVSIVCFALVCSIFMNEHALIRSHRALSTLLSLAGSGPSTSCCTATFFN